MPVTDIRPTGPETRFSSLRTPSIAATPSPPPIRVAQIDPSCLRSSRISPAAAAAKTPAAKCWMALTGTGPGRRFTATVAPRTAAAAGIRV